MARRIKIEYKMVCCGFVGSFLTGAPKKSGGKLEKISSMKRDS